MKNRVRLRAVLLAFLAAVFYALNAPFSKRLLSFVSSAYMAAFLYLGAGAGVRLLYAFRRKREAPEERLSRKDLPYTLGMILLDILAPLLLMFGLRSAEAANASLLGNFEIVATALIARLLFREKVSFRLWAAIGFITLSSILLTFEGAESFRFSPGSLLVVLATCCWGLENNCTRSISHKSAYEIVTVKGLCSGTGAFLIAAIAREPLPEMQYVLYALLLGFVAYGLSIFMYVRAQRELGAARTGAYYAAAPFVGVALSVGINGERPGGGFWLALAVMAAGSVLAVLDTFANEE